MRSSVFFVLGLATSLASLSTAHTVLTTLFINDVNQGDGTCIRMSKEGSVSTHPIASFESVDMACGRDGEEAVAFTCPSPAGAKLTFEFRMWADASQPGSIDPSHLGSIAVYLKRVSNITTDSAAGPGWFKIYDDGYDNDAGKWATEKLIDSNGLLSIKMPSGLSTGYYLVRTEILTLQNVVYGMVDPQFYVNCAQLFVEGQDGGSDCIPEHKQVSIPGYVGASDPGLVFNVYEDDPVETPYQVVGPDPYFPISSSSSSSSPSSSTTRRSRARAADRQTDGRIPDDCLLKNANWCGVEVPAYTDEASCWAASADCFRQLDHCFAAAPPTGSRGCARWLERKCLPIQQACAAGLWHGPPAMGQRIDDYGVNAAVPGGKIPDAVNAGQGWRAREGLSVSVLDIFFGGGRAVVVDGDAVRGGCGTAVALGLEL